MLSYLENKADSDSHRSFWFMFDPHQFVSVCSVKQQMWTLSWTLVKRTKPPSAFKCDYNLFVLLYFPTSTFLVYSNQVQWTTSEWKQTHSRPLTDVVALRPPRQGRSQNASSSARSRLGRPLALKVKTEAWHSAEVLQDVFRRKRFACCKKQFLWATSNLQVLPVGDRGRAGGIK